MIETIVEISIEIGIEEVETVIEIEIMTEKVGVTEASRIEIETVVNETADGEDATEKKSTVVLKKVHILIANEIEMPRGQI